MDDRFPTKKPQKDEGSIIMKKNFMTSKEGALQAA